MARKKIPPAACDWRTRECRACDAGLPPMSSAAIRRGLTQLDGWKLVRGTIRKTFQFKNYHQTMAFVNATAWISHRENHHPNLAVDYNRCTVSYHTHAIDGITENDFICAAKIDALVIG